MAPSTDRGAQGTASLEWLFALSALGFLLLLPLSPYPGSYILKIVPIACLLLTVLHGSGRQYRLIALALVFSATGDVSLELDYFLPGLGAFLLGHLCYTAAFWGDFRWNTKTLSALAALSVCVLLMLLYLSPHLGDMRWPVYGYIAVIVAMAVAALCGGHNHALVGLGAVLFLVSDALIAITRFAQPLPGSSYWIMTTYYCAQYLLTRDARRGSDT
ncbi:MAG: lysoplasmalogenase [Pseudomonadota bacterium]